MNEADTVPVHTALLQAIADVPLAYVHFLMEPQDPVLAQLRPEVTVPFLLNTGFAIESDFAQLRSSSPTAPPTRSSWVAARSPTPTRPSVSSRAPSSPSPIRRCSGRTWP